ncbi:hypothetical protein [Gluconobacter kondonii]|uniref:Uncharacterized protein n=1 Tax=Gluconobacter kondonii TaxID=941463 RepID=A0ABQ5WUW1_9PROT|nr:hypothetical protein [Gluconobacter kondonii]GBR34613.1 hypothetical protein AA3266_1855 [Gluconobacter kondonii NBRC 3266]GLQ67331.1 hypothetical protein GCM10007870_29160 [Gluconobacter kondonii]
MRSSIRELARVIYFSEGEVDLYKLHLEYRLSPFEVSFAARFFVKVGIAELDGISLVLRTSAKEWLFERRQRFFMQAKRPWANDLRDGVDPSEPYLPELSRVDRDFFYRKLRHLEL